MTAPVATAEAQTQTAYAIDPAHSVAEFAVKHLVVATVKGTVAIKTGRLVYDPAHPAHAAVEAELDAASIATGVADRDGHLRSPDFFDATAHPSWRFRSRRVEPKRDAEARVVGDLTIRGVTREVVLDVVKEGEAKDPWGNHRAAFTATTAFDRKDFGLTWNQTLETGGLLVGDKVKVTLHVQAVRQG